MRLEIQERNLDILSKQISILNDDDVMKSHLARYFCVLVSGYIENYIKELIYEYHSKTCKKETARFISIKLQNLTNLDDSKIIKFLLSFSDSWAEIYKRSRTDVMESAFNAVYAQPNKIAHGNASNSNISYVSISEYYEGIKSAMKLLSSIIKK